MKNESFDGKNVNHSVGVLSGQVLRNTATINAQQHRIEGEE